MKPRLYFLSSVAAVILLLWPATASCQTAQSTSEKLLTYGLVLDNSGSMRTELPRVKEIAKLIIGTNRPNDETFIVSLMQERKPALLVDVTTDKSILLAGLNSLKTKPGQTTLMDGIHSSADYLSQLKNTRADRQCALVIVSDGEDRASSYRPERVLGLLKAVNCPLFFVGFLDQLDETAGLIRESPRLKAKKLIEQLTNGTGGRAFFVEKSSDLNTLVSALNKVLRD
jgi:VWFA-related protein